VGDTIHGARATRLCSDASIHTLMKDNIGCQCSKDCFLAWRASLGPGVARAIIKTERHAYGAMTQPARFHHYSVIIRSNLNVKTVVSSRGEGLLQTGEYAREVEVVSV